MLVVLAGCWRDGPGAPPPPLRPPGTVRVAPERPKSRWRSSRPVAYKATAPARTPQEIARDLQTALRTNPLLVSRYVDGPIVVLDLDAGTLTTECGAAALPLAQQWAQQLADPKRPEPHCRGSLSYTCSQFATQQILIVELEEPEQWRIVSVIVGNFTAGRSTMNAKIALMRSQIASAACP